MMLKLALAALFLITLTATAHAQGGCVDSPEPPTAFLALVGSAGISLAFLRQRHK